MKFQRLDEKTPFYVQICSDTDQAVPAEIQLLPIGKTYIGADKYIIVDDIALKKIAEYFASRSTDPVIDYEHQTETGDVAPAAGWIKGMTPRADGMYGRIEWCSPASKMIAAKEYRYLSPVIEIDKASRRVIRILRAALTNAPRLPNIKAIVNKDDFGGGDPAEETQNEQGENMEEIIKALGLPPEATTADILKAISDLQTKVTDVEAQAAKKVACKAVLTELALPESAGETVVLGAIKGLKAGKTGAETLATEVAALKGRIAERDAADEVQTALKAGKITPAQVDWAKNYAKTDIEGFKAFAKNSPVRVQLGAGKKGTDTPPEGELSEAETEVCSQLGLSPKNYKKFKENK